MKYKLINKVTQEEHLCGKITIDGFDYYMTYPEKCCIQKEGKTVMNKGCMERNHCEKVIATNNPNIDIPKVVNEIEKLAFDYHEQVKRNYYSTGQKAQLPKSNKEFQAMGDGFIDGYNKSQEMFPFTEEDMIEFAEWCQNQYFYSTVEKKWSTEFKIYDGVLYTTKELLKIWKKQQPKIVYYNG